METIGNILREIKTIRREMNINSRKQTSDYQELAERYRQEAAYGELLAAQAKRLSTLAAFTIGAANASRESVLGWIEQEQLQAAPVSVQTQLDLPF